MKKPSTLAEQIQQAQREVSSWPPELRAAVRLEGNSSMASRHPEPRHLSTQAHKTAGRKNKPE